MSRASRALVLLLALALILAHGAAEELSVSEYAKRLARLRAALDGGDYADARGQAERLLTVRVRFQNERLQPDRSVLVPVTQVREVTAARSFIERLRVLEESLRPNQAPAPMPTHTADDKLLSKLRHEQAVRDPQVGGDVARVPDPSSGYGDAIIKIFKDVWRWLWGRLVSFLRWVANLFTSSAPGQRWSWEEMGPLTLMLTLLLLGIVGLLTWDSIKKNRRRLENAQPVPSDARGAQVADADPTSRDTNEWETFARQLFAEGKHREAVRAWYHALLTTLFRAGHLHYRKGRTNWEYCNDLSPALEWRPVFLETTRVFEHRWYGQASASSEDLLAYAEDVGHIRASVRAREAA